MAISTVNIGSAPNDGTGDPLRTAFNKLNTNFLNITADGGDEITVTDPTTSTDQTLNDALANIYASGGGGSVTSVNGDTGVVVVDLQSATDEGNTTTNDIIITDGSTQLAKMSNNGGEGSVSVTDGTNNAYMEVVQIGLTNSSLSSVTTLSDGTVANIISGGSPQNVQLSLKDKKITVDSVDYPFPNGVSSQIATLADITGGVTDGDKGDITVGSSGTVWTIDNGAVTDEKLASQKVDTLLNDNVDSSAVTGTVANTILKSYLIPADTLAVGDTIDVKAVCSKTGTNANCNFRLYTNTSNSLTSASTLALVTPASTNLYFSLDRTYTLKSGNTLESFPVSSSAVTDEAPNNTSISNTAFDPTVDNYFIVAVQPNNSADSFKQTLCYMTRMKAKTSI